MPVDVLTGFVDRMRELILFRRMLAGETDKRILCILERSEQGKTYFLLRLFYECEQCSIPVILLDFDQRRSGLTDYLGIAREVRRYLGDDRTPAICACEERMSRRQPLVNVCTGNGDAGVDWGRRGRFDDADIVDVTGRDFIHIGNVSGGAPTAGDVRKQRVDMGRALCGDLGHLGQEHNRVVLLLDTFEQAREETCGWLERWLLEPLRRQLSHVLIVVAGRPQCRPFFDLPRLWSGLVTHIDRFAPFSEDDILAHYQQRGLVVPEAERSLLLDLARLGPAPMAQVGDWLQQRRGGER